MISDVCCAMLIPLPRHDCLFYILLKYFLTLITNFTNHISGTHNLELKPKASKEKLTKKVKTRKSIAMKPQRRHAADILILAKSVDPGCNCPPPGKPNGNKV